MTHFNYFLIILVLVSCVSSVNGLTISPARQLEPGTTTTLYVSSLYPITIITGVGISATPTELPPGNFSETIITVNPESTGGVVFIENIPKDGTLSAKVGVIVSVNRSKEQNQITDILHQNESALLYIIGILITAACVWALFIHKYD